MEKISILMPTFNDAEYILQSINSLKSQSYENWEIIIVNDGSADDTESIIKSINDPRIKYYVQKNMGQLNAVLAGSQFIEGDIILLFHSDDELANNDVFSKIIDTFKKHPDIDGLYADYLTIDKNSNLSGVMKRPASINEKELIRKVFFHKGDNLIGDTFIVKKEIFYKYVLPNYIYDNTIYYVDYQNFKILNLLKIEPWYKYRVFGDNYINSDVGKFEVSNGCFRTVYKLLSNRFETGPLFVFNNLLGFKIFRKLKLYNYFPVKKGESIDVNLALKIYTLWKEELITNHYPSISIKQIEKILHSINSLGNQNKALFIKNEDFNSVTSLFYGKDARRFYNEYKSQTISSIYKKVLETDYDHIVVENVEDKETVENILHFYSLFYEVKVERA